MYPFSKVKAVKPYKKVQYINFHAILFHFCHVLWDMWRLLSLTIILFLIHTKRGCKLLTEVRLTHKQTHACTIMWYPGPKLSRESLHQPGNTFIIHTETRSGYMSLYMFDRFRWYLETYHPLLLFSILSTLHFAVPIDIKVLYINYYFVITLQTHIL